MQPGAELRVMCPVCRMLWLLPVALRAVVFKLLVWCGAEGYVSGLQDAALK